MCSTKLIRDLALRMLTIKPIFFFKSVFIFNWRIIALQYCVGFCHTLTRTNGRDTYISTLVNLPPTSRPIPPSMLSWSTGPSTLYHTANSHWLSVLHVVMCMFLYYPLISSPTLLPSLCPEICSPYVCLHGCL